MTIEQDFLPFAVGGSANVLSQSAYAALTSLLQNGFQSGIAPSVQLNKVWRQSSIMAAVLAQFIVDRSGQSAVDDGTITTLLANLKASAAALNGDPSQAFNVASATTLTHAPEAGQVQRSAFNYAGLAGGTANAITATLSPAPGSYSDYLLVTVRIAATNTSSASLNVNGLGVVPVIGLGHQTLQGGELFAGGFATFAYSTNYSEAILLECTGGALQVAPATQSQHAAQLAQLLAVSGPQAVLSYTNSTTITLSRYRTGYVYSPGYGVVQIPSGGLTATASGLTSGTLYYVYLNPNSGSPTLVASTTAHQTDASGVEVMVGDNTKVLVGMAYAVTATSWLSVVRSWVHDRGISLTAVLNTSSSTNSTTPVNVNTGLQISFLAWTSELAQFSVNASCSINTTNTNIETYISLNNSAISGAVASATPATTNVISETVTINSQSVVEGLNTVNMFGQVGSSSATGTWYANQTSTNVTIAPRA
jgi:hypothetical protein